MATEFTSPIGRWVQGDFFEPQTTDQAGNPLVYKSGPQVGQPRKTWFAGVAFDKRNPEFNAFYGLIHQEARNSFAALFDATGRCTHPRFAFKVIDGDGVDDSGKPWSSREGFAGHWVVRLTSGYAPSVYMEGKYDPTQKLTAPSCAFGSVKRGDYVRVIGNIQGNGDQQKPGVHVNLNCVVVVGVGDAIVSGPNVAQAMSGAAPAGYVPEGMRANPAAPMAGQMAQPGLAPQPMAQPGLAPQPMAQPGLAPQPMAQPGLAPQPMAQPGLAPQPMAHQPNHNLVANALAAPGAVAPVIAAPVVPQMGPNAQGFTYEQWKAEGYSDDQLRGGGVIL